MKYVIYENDQKSFAVLLPNCVAHKTSHGMVRENDLRYATGSGGWFKPVAAGFVEIKDGVVRCYGESETLGLKSRGEADDVIVNQLLQSGRYD